jgi:hypothetical protein
MGEELMGSERTYPGVYDIPEWKRLVEKEKAKNVSLTKELTKSKIQVGRFLGFLAAKKFSAEEVKVVLHDKKTRKPCEIHGNPNCESLGCQVDIRERLEEPEELFYIRDTRSYVGNCVLWWRAGRNGYTTNLDDAEQFVREEAEKICSERDTDVMYPVSKMENIARLHVDHQDLQA